MDKDWLTYGYTHTRVLSEDKYIFPDGKINLSYSLPAASFVEYGTRDSALLYLPGVQSDLTPSLVAPPALKSQRLGIDADRVLSTLLQIPLASYTPGRTKNVRWSVGVSSKMDDPPKFISNPVRETNGLDKSGQLLIDVPEIGILPHASVSDVSAIRGNTAELAKNLLAIVKTNIAKEQGGKGADGAAAEGIAKILGKPRIFAENLNVDALTFDCMTMHYFPWSPEGVAEPIRTTPPGGMRPIVRETPPSPGDDMDARPCLMLVLLTFGAPRIFDVNRDSTDFPKEAVLPSFYMNHGSMLVLMGEDIQKFYGYGYESIAKPQDGRDSAEINGTWCVAAFRFVLMPRRRQQVFFLDRERTRHEFRMEKDLGDNDEVIAEQLRAYAQQHLSMDMHDYLEDANAAFNDLKEAVLTAEPNAKTGLRAKNGKYWQQSKYGDGFRAFYPTVYDGKIIYHEAQRRSVSLNADGTIKAVRKRPTQKRQESSDSGKHDPFDIDDDDVEEEKYRGSSSSSSPLISQPSPKPPSSIKQPSSSSSSQQSSKTAPPMKQNSSSIPQPKPLSASSSSSSSSIPPKPYAINIVSDDNDDDANAAPAKNPSSLSPPSSSSSSSNLKSTSPPSSSSSRQQAAPSPYIKGNSDNTEFMVDGQEFIVDLGDY